MTLQELKELFDAQPDMASAKESRSNNIARLLGMGKVLAKRWFDQGLQDEVVLLRSSIKNLENKFNVDRTALLSQMAQKTMEDMPLEDKVVKHLTGRSLFLDQIANYCQVAPKDILSTLAHMRKKGMVDQDPQMRWHMKCTAK